MVSIFSGLLCKVGCIGVRAAPMGGVGRATHDGVLARVLRKCSITRARAGDGEGHVSPHFAFARRVRVVARNASAWCVSGEGRSIARRMPAVSLKGHDIVIFE